MDEKPKYEVKFSDSFINDVCNLALQLIEQGKIQGFIDAEHLGELSVFVNQQPSSVFLSFPAELLKPEMKGQFIFVGK